MRVLKFNYWFISSILLLIFISSCNKDDDPVTPQEEPVTPQEEEYQSTQISENITELFVTSGNASGDTVWLYEQGGPSKELNNDLDAFPNWDNYLIASVHQVLTYNNGLYDKDLTVSQGEQETDVNTEILQKVIQHFKGQGKTVFVIGHSYGAFVVTRYLSDKSSALADKYVILAGRLDIQQTLFEGLINKQYYYFPEFTTPVLHPTTQPISNIDSTELFLGGIIMKPRYTQELSDKDLTKVIYAFANDDGSVGRLTSDEKNFLISKSVQVVEIETGDHSAMFETPNNQTIYNLMIQ
jgi:hypothetical protein